MLTRRDVVVRGLGGAALALAGWPGPVRAAPASGAARLLVVLLRGGMDGLAAAPPLSDPLMSKLRPNLRLHNARPLDGRFGLHPALETLHALWSAQQLAVVHATGFRYTGRSHFEGQDVMQSGVMKPYASASGWVGRAMQAARLTSGVAISIPMPLILRGHPGASTEYPDPLPPPPRPLSGNVQKLWAGDKALAGYGDILFQAVMDGGQRAGKMSRQEFQEAIGPAQLARIAAEQMLPDDGPRVGLIDIDHGFDTHAAQGADEGLYADKLKELDDVVRGFRETMADRWSQSLVITVTEFGRTVAENGTRGTDHGVGSCCFLAGGLIDRARVYADWRGLDRKDLFEDRDLPATIDVCAVYARVLQRAFHLDANVVRSEVLTFEPHPAIDELLA